MAVVKGGASGRSLDLTLSSMGNWGRFSSRAYDIIGFIFQEAYLGSWTEDRIREVKSKRREFRWEDLELVQGRDQRLGPSIWSPSSLGIGFLVSGLSNWRDDDPLSSHLINKCLSQTDTPVVIVT